MPGETIEIDIKTIDEIYNELNIEVDELDNEVDELHNEILETDEQTDLYYYEVIEHLDNINIRLNNLDTIGITTLIAIGLVFGGILASILSNYFKKGS